MYLLANTKSSWNSAVKRNQPILSAFESYHPLRGSLLYASTLAMLGSTHGIPRWSRRAASLLHCFLYLGLSQKVEFEDLVVTGCEVRRIR